MAAPETKKPSTQRLAWAGLFALIVILGIVYSLVQPLGLSPDEAAHARYIKFLASHGRLPLWNPDGGGEAGYEAQHPPLYYTIGAVIYRASTGLLENWRWQLLRWYSLLIGCILIWAARGFFADCFRGRFAQAFAATAALGLTPLLAEYASHVNPDIMSVLWCCVVLWMCVRIARGEASRRDRVVLGAAFGLGLLTKLTALGTLPVIALAHVWDPQAGAEAKWERRRMLLMETLLGAAAIAGWWYFRNSLLYRTPFIHTTGRFGSGLDIVTSVGRAPHFLWLTLKNTYITTWVERAWLPPGAVGLAAYLAISALLVVAVGSAVVRLVRARPAVREPDRAAWLCGILLIGLVLFHQAQVWLVDYEFNAGGRYLLNGMVTVEALVIASFGAMKRSGLWYAAWAGVFAVTNAISIHYMLTAVNPTLVPDWHVLHLTVPYR